MSAYRGRFAPTPSGPLHLGSLFAAVVSWLDARFHQGEWLLRIDDLDPPREQPGASTAILKTLEAHGLNWDGEVCYQSRHQQRYEARLAQLQALGRLFWCSCSRRQLKDFPVYPGTCRKNTTPEPDRAIRLRVDTSEVAFDDRFQGRQHSHIAQEFGDVVLKRRDALFAYQLAVVTDDIDAGITDIVRGIDLMPSTFWQSELYRLFDTSPPRYAHFAVLHNQKSTQKLSKQNLAPAVDDDQPENNLIRIFDLLNLPVTPDTCARMLEQAASAYTPDLLFNRQQMHIDLIQLD